MLRENKDKVVEEMKRKMNRLAAIVCLTLCMVIMVPCLLSSCSNTDEEDNKEKVENAILGTWQGVDKFGDVRKLTFNPDGTVEYRWISGSYEKVDSGTYSLMMTRNGNEVWIDLEESHFSGVEFEYNEDSGSLTLKKDEIYFVKIH